MKDLNRSHIMAYALMVLMILAIFALWGLMFAEVTGGRVPRHANSFTFR